MSKSTKTADDVLIRTLGERLARLRIARNLTQAQLAEQAGISKRSLERLESGSVATQLSGFLRVCRILGLLERLDLFLPEPAPSPIAQLKLHGKQRRRASRARAATPVPKPLRPRPARTTSPASASAAASPSPTWQWADQPRTQA